MIFFFCIFCDFKIFSENNNFPQSNVQTSNSNKTCHSYEHDAGMYFFFIFIEKILANRKRFFEETVIITGGKHTNRIIRYGYM